MDFTIIVQLYEVHQEISIAFVLIRKVRCSDDECGWAGLDWESACIPAEEDENNLLALLCPICTDSIEVIGDEMVDGNWLMSVTMNIEEEEFE